MESMTNGVKWICPECHAPVMVNEASAVCGTCRKTFPVDSGIPCFSNRASTWKLGVKNSSTDVIEHAERNGWEAALATLDRKKAAWIRGEDRFAVPVLANPKGRVLDCGCGWGGLTFRLANEFDQVHAFDAELDGLQFIRIRAKQSRIDNIAIVQGDLLALPFPDGYFDVVVLNGVLEWVGTCDDRCAPELLQERAVAEVVRVLQPAGVLFVAIENRFGIQYFLGYKEEHTGLRFISLLPRPLARWYHRMARGSEFRALTHSWTGLKKLLSKQGLQRQVPFAVFPSYRNCRYLSSLGHPFTLGYLLKMLAERNKKRFGGLMSAAMRLACASGRLLSITAWFSPSCIIMASRNEWPGLGLRSTSEPIVLGDKSGPPPLAIAINDRRANVFQMDGKTGRLAYKFAFPINGLASRKMELSKRLPDLLERVNSKLKGCFAASVLYVTPNGFAMRTEAASGSSLQLADRREMRLFHEKILELCRADIPGAMERESFKDADIRGTLAALVEKHGLDPGLKGVIDRFQVIHGDLNAGNIFVDKADPWRIVLLDFEHACIGPAILNWYDFLLRNFVLKEDIFPVANAIAHERYRRLIDGRLQGGYIRELSLSLLRECELPAHLHGQLMLLYMIFLCRNRIVTDAAGLIKELLVGFNKS